MAALELIPKRNYDDIAKDLGITADYVRGVASVESRKAEAVDLRRKKPHRERRVAKLYWV